MATKSTKRPAKKSAHKPDKTPYMKTAKAEVRLHFNGKQMELTVALPKDMGRILARRLRKRTG